MTGSDIKWWQKAVIYQVYPRSFMDSNSDGVGDLNGIQSKLDYLAWLGIDTIWLSPIYPSPMADFGYDISDYTNVAPVFGTLADFDNLLAETHRRGLKLLLDLVPNHTSDEHPWFQESRSSRSNPKRDWYIWRDPAADGGPPNNWFSQFGGSAWQYDELTGQYYLHSFDIKQADLNWRNPQVRQAIYNVMRFWLDRGLDGFRIDVLERLIKDAQFRDNPLNPDWRPADPDFEQVLEVYSNDQPEVHEIVQEMRQVAEQYDDRVLIGEIYLPYPRLMRYYGPNLDEAHLPFNFKLIQLANWDARAVAAIVEEYEAGLPAGSWPNWVLSNHDRPRLITRIGPSQARVAQMLLLTLRGTPTCYYGDELGMHNVPISPEQTYDPLGKSNQALNRDPVRTPMQWDSSPNAGFCKPEVSPWLPLADDYTEINVSTETADNRSLLALCRQLLQLRRNLPALQVGNYREVKSENRHIFAYQREYAGQKLLVLLNFNLESQQANFPELGEVGGEVLCSTNLDRSGEHIASLSQVKILPHEGLLISLQPKI